MCILCFSWLFGVRSFSTMSVVFFMSRLRGDFFLLFFEVYSILASVSSFLFFYLIHLFFFFRSRFYNSFFFLFTDSSFAFFIQLILIFLLTIFLLLDFLTAADCYPFSFIYSSFSFGYLSFVSFTFPFYFSFHLSFLFFHLLSLF